MNIEHGCVHRTQGQAGESTICKWFIQDIYSNSLGLKQFISKQLKFYSYRE